MSALYVVSPNGKTFEEWAAAVIMAGNGVFRSDSAIPDDWRLWAAHVASNNTLTKMSIPNPYFHDAWEDWANAFNSALGSAGM